MRRVPLDLKKVEVITILCCALFFPGKAAAEWIFDSVAKTGGLAYFTTAQIGAAAGCAANALLLSVGVGRLFSVDCEGEVIAVRGDFSGVLTSSAQVTSTVNPAGTTFAAGSIIANPAACGANEILIGGGVAGTGKITGDCEGDLVAVKGDFSGVLTSVAGAACSAATAGTCTLTNGVNQTVGLSLMTGDATTGGVYLVATELDTTQHGAALTICHRSSNNGGSDNCLFDLRNQAGSNTLDTLQVTGNIYASQNMGQSTTTMTGASYLTGTNCADSAGAAACGSAAAGAFVLDAAATTVVVSTTAVTANSEIFIQEDSSLATRLSISSCTPANAGLYFSRVTARTAGASFTVGTFAAATGSALAPTTNPDCFNYHIVN